MRLRRRVVEPIDILCVCTGNLCRSPIMETLLKAELPHLRIESRGTHAPVGEPWHPLALEVLAERGHVVSGHAQQLTARDVKAATLVLTAEGWHRAEVVRLDPTAEERVFALLEAARLLSTGTEDSSQFRTFTGVHALAGQLAAELHASPIEGKDDIEDPIDGDLVAFQGCARGCAEGAAVLAAALPTRT